MKTMKIAPRMKLRGTVVMPGDKSISHRAAILAALAGGKTQIRNFLFSDDCLATIKVLQSLGIKVLCQLRRSVVVINSKGFLRASKRPLFMRESGTSARVLLGVLAGQKFISKVTASPSLMKRPMLRVIKPLRLMGARIKARKIRGKEFLPLEILPSSLSGIRWVQEVSSAQVKSAVLLAGLFAKGETAVKESVVTRDHTEKMLKYFGAAVKVVNKEVRLRPSVLKTPGKIIIPGDFSSAAFFIVAALLVKNAKIVIKDVGMNPTRLGAFYVLKRMGGKIKVFNRRGSFEPVADIAISSSRLKAVTIKAQEIPSLIDELPVLMVAAGMAKGKTVIEGAGELRVKETDRIKSMSFNLKRLGVKVDVYMGKAGECVEITGSEFFKGAVLKSFSDHRTAMSVYVAALAAGGNSVLEGPDCISKSFPNFFVAMNQLFEI
ncbi:MAG: 3-phosphoshikimate 1-carboxyvinyltransferase [Candidatus Omnitrophota bacterium]